MSRDVGGQDYESFRKQITGAESANQNGGTCMPIATAEEKAKATNQDVEELKTEIRKLYSNYQTRRLELGMKLLQLQQMLVHFGTGTFTHVATVELKIPHATMYRLLDYAEAEIKRIGRLSRNGTKSDCDVDFSDPEEVADLLRKCEEEAIRDKDEAYRRRKPMKDKQYIAMVHLKFIFPKQTRLRVARAWKIVKSDEEAMKKLSWKIAKEGLHAATRLKKTADQ